jgi:phosphatidylinositol alpha-1,6-mannosyltransferase
MGTEVWGPMGMAERCSIRACHRLLAISSFTGAQMAERSGIDRSRVTVVHLPVAETLLAEARRDLGGAADEARILSVSRLARQHRYKGHFEVATALQTVLHESPSVRWVVIGEGPDRARLEERCAVLGIRASVDFLGAVSDERLAAEYRRATALVLPSLADARQDPPVGEGFGLVYAEAGAFGVPSIAHRRGGGALDYVRQGETGLTIDDPETLAAAILRLVREPELRNRLGAAARALTFERHTTERFTQELTQALGG